MSQNIRAAVSSRSDHGSTSKVEGSGRASTSLSWMRLKPSIAEPSNCMPSSKAFSSSAGEMATDFSWPSTSVNHSRTSRMPRSSTVRRTYSICRSTAPIMRVPGAVSKLRRPVHKPFTNRARALPMVCSPPFCRATSRSIGRVVDREPTARSQGGFDRFGTPGVARGGRPAP